MAGGTVYWIMSTNWKRGSEGRSPKCVAAFTTPIPAAGSNMYLTTITAITSFASILDFLNPAFKHCRHFHPSLWPHLWAPFYFPTRTSFYFLNEPINFPIFFNFCIVNVVSYSSVL